jgi:hypothetical protein
LTGEKWTFLDQNVSTLNSYNFSSILEQSFPPARPKELTRRGFLWFIPSKAKYKAGIFAFFGQQLPILPASALSWLSPITWPTTTPKRHAYNQFDDC